MFFGPKGGDGKEPGTKTQGWYGKPPLRGRQTTAINHETGAASKGQLVLVEALPEGMCMRAHVWVSDELWEAASVSSLLGETREARLGSRKLTGTFGSATCTLREETAAEREARIHFGNAGSAQLTSAASSSADGTAPGVKTPASSSDVYLWFTSDVLARSSALGPGGSVEDLELAFRRANVPVTVVRERTDGEPHSRPDQDSDDKNRKRVLTAIRHRRVDSWSPRDNGPRATRLAIQAGSVVQVRLSPDDLGSLKALGHIGVGELTPQGYGRFLVGSPILAKATLPLFKTRSKSFTASTEATS